MNLVVASLYAATRASVIPSYFLSKMFDMDGEGTFCSWYSSAQMLLCALCWYLVTLRCEGRQRFIACAGTLFFLALSIDETAQIHEYVNAVAIKKTNSTLQSSGPIVFLGIPILISFYLLWRRWPWPARARDLLFGGLAGFILSATGIEVLINWIPFHTPAFYIEVFFEETGELMGISTALLGSCLHLNALSSPEASSASATVARELVERES